MTIRVDGLTEANAYLERLTREMPRAAIKATDRLVFKVWEAEKAQMVADLDRPKPFSLGAVRYKRPRMTDPVGEVYLADRHRPGQVAREGDAYLGVQVSGGRRTRPRASELAMQQMGLMRPGFVWVPAPGVRVDAYGNVPGATIKRMIAEFRAYGTARRDGRRFYLRGGVRVPPVGVYYKVGRRWMPLLQFLSPRQYQKRYSFYERADQEIAYHFRPIYLREIERETERRGA